MTLIAASELISDGLRLEPTGRNPRHYTVGFDEIDQGMKVLAGCQRQIMTNPYHEG